jgi:hypothetical protein
MFAFFTEHEFMPCERCGASVGRADRNLHTCDERRRLDYELTQLLRGDVDRFDDELAAYLETPEGRFAVYYAARQRVSDVR